MRRRRAIEDVIHRVLDPHYVVVLTADRIELSEDIENGQACIICDLINGRNGQRHRISGNGFGVRGAFFNALVQDLSPKYSSLKTIVPTHLEATQRVARTAKAVNQHPETRARLSMTTWKGREFRFTSTADSTTRAIVDVTLKAVLFFVNAERAFSTLFHAVEHAKYVGRADSVDHYTAQLSILVETTSYEDVIEELKQQTSIADHSEVTDLNFGAVGLSLLPPP